MLVKCPECGAVFESTSITAICTHCHNFHCGDVTCCGESTFEQATQSDMMESVLKRLTGHTHVRDYTPLELSGDECRALCLQLGLLEKYVEHIVSMESYDYITPHGNRENTFTEEEWEEMKRVSKRVSEKHQSKLDRS